MNSSSNESEFFSDSDSRKGYRPLRPPYQAKIQMTPADLFTDQKTELLLRNGSGANKRKNHVPISFLRLPGMNYRFLITELDNRNPDFGFGLAEYDGNVRIDTINLKKLIETAVNKFEYFDTGCDFTGKYNLAVYAQVAFELSTIIVDDSDKGYGDKFIKYAEGKNIDPLESLQNLKPKLVWL